MRTEPVRIAALVAVAALATSCPHNVTSDFPLSVGYAPLEACTAEDPPLVGGAYPEALGAPVGQGAYEGFCWTHRRGYLRRPIAEVWDVLRTCPCVSRIHTNHGFSSSGPVEDFPLSFEIAVEETSVVGIVHWNHRYRGGPDLATGGPGPPTAYGVRFQKVFGVANIRQQSGSLQLTAVDPGTTELAFVVWLDADRSGLADAEGAITDWYGELKNVLDTGDCTTCPSF